MYLNYIFLPGKYFSLGLAPEREFICVLSSPFCDCAVYYLFCVSVLEHPEMGKPAADCPSPCCHQMLSADASGATLSLFTEGFWGLPQVSINSPAFHPAAHYMLRGASFIVHMSGTAARSSRFFPCREHPLLDNAIFRCFWALTSPTFSFSSQNFSVPACAEGCERLPHQAKTAFLI